MDWSVWIVGALMLVAALSAGFALGLHLLIPRWSLRRRVVAASGMAAFCPMSLAFGGLLAEASEMLRDDVQDFALGLLALCVLQAMLWAIIALPPAWFVSTRLQRGRERLSDCSEAGSKVANAEAEAA